MIATTIRLPDDKLKKLKQVALTEHKSLNNIVTHLIDDYLKEYYTDEYICPHCGKSEHILNDETLRALKDSRSETEIKEYESAEEMFQDLNK